MESEGLGGKREREDTLELFKWFGRRHSDWGEGTMEPRKGKDRLHVRCILETVFQDC